MKAVATLIWFLSVHRCCRMDDRWQEGHLACKQSCHWPQKLSSESSDKISEVVVVVRDASPVPICDYLRQKQYINN